ncbi:MAG: hypothetical protein ACE5OW_04740 [Candidatus Bathyarchaeia archaeon]
MEKQPELKERFCGNCRHHNVYEYPDLILCFVRYQKHEDPIVPTLGCCEEWEFDPQECFCLQEVLRKRNERKG